MQAERDEASGPTAAGSASDASAAGPESHFEGLGRQGLLSAGAVVVPGLYSVVAIGAILRTLGPESYAPWATAVVLLGWLNLLDLGLGQTVVRAAARAALGDEAAKRDVSAATAVYAGIGAITAVAGIAIAALTPFILGLPPSTAGTAYLTGVILALDAGLVLATSPWAGTLRGAGRFGQLMATSVVQVTVSLPLLLILLPVFGLPGAAVAQLAGRLASRVAMLVPLRRSQPWFRARPSRPDRSALIHVARFSAPLFLMQLATQIGTGTDILIVGAVLGAAATGLYAAGVQLVRYLAYFIFPAIDVVYPRLASIEYARPHLAGPALVRALFLAAAVGTAAFVGLALDGETALALWAGRSEGLSVATLAIYGLAYAVITPAHVLVIGTIARGQHRTVAGVILVEAVVNLGLSVVLTRAIGPLGPALSTLVVVLVDDLLVIPWVASRGGGPRLLDIARATLGGAATGIAIVGLSRLIPGDAEIAALARGATVASLVAIVVAIGLRRALPGAGPEVVPGARGIEAG